MVDLYTTRCSHAMCTRGPYFNIKGSKKAAYCRQHATDGMVDIRSRQCLHNSCVTFPSFNVEGSRTAAYCRRHAEVGMIDIHTKRCSYDGCPRQALWGALSGGVGTACADHKSTIIADGPVIHFRASCQVTGCRVTATWGLSGGQPSHCHIHGPLEDSLVLTVESKRRKTVPRCASPGAAGGSSPRVKAEVKF